MMKKTVFVFIAIVFISGCENPTDGRLNEVYKYPKELWGEWIRMDTGDTWYITSNYLKATMYSSNVSSDIELKKQSPNVIEVTDDGKKYYLYASRNPTGTIRGSVLDGSDVQKSVSVSRSLSGLGGAGVTIANLKDKANELSTETDENGDFTADGIIPGDDYEVTVEGQTTTVSPNTNDSDIGIITVTSGVNFKTSIKSGHDLMQLYAENNTAYSFTIEVANTGTEDCLGATFELTPDPGITITEPSSRILGTIEPGKKRSIPITIKCGPIDYLYVFKRIKVSITDQINKKTWEDSVSLKFNKKPVTFRIASSGAVSGIIIVPDAKAQSFRISGYSNLSTDITVPWSDKNYLVVFSGATADTEVSYSLGLNVAASTVFSGTDHVGNYEPNNLETTATFLDLGSQIKAYLHKNDIDYYTVKLGN
jgi:hypothetical protein